MDQVKDKLPLKVFELEEELEKIRAIAHQSFDTVCTESGVPDDDVTREVHLGEMDEVLQLQWDGAVKENEKVILEIIQEKQNEYESQLREAVDQLPTEDLLGYCDEHDKVLTDTPPCLLELTVSVLPDTEGPR